MDKRTEWVHKFCTIGILHQSKYIADRVYVIDIDDE